MAVLSGKKSVGSAQEDKGVGRQSREGAPKQQPGPMRDSVLVHIIKLHVLASVLSPPIQRRGPVHQVDMLAKRVLIAIVDKVLIDSRQDVW